MIVQDSKMLTQLKVSDKIMPLGRIFSNISFVLGAMEFIDLYSIHSVSEGFANELMQICDFKNYSMVSTSKISSSTIFNSSTS
jgi:hypothetical protein